MTPRNCNSSIFGSHHCIDSNSAVLNSVINFLDKNARYSRTYCTFTCNIGEGRVGDPFVHNADALWYYVDKIYEDIY